MGKPPQRVFRGITIVDLSSIVALTKEGIERSLLVVHSFGYTRSFVNAVYTFKELLNGIKKNRKNKEKKGEERRRAKSKCSLSIFSTVRRCNRTVENSQEISSIRVLHHLSIYVYLGAAPIS